ARPGRGRAAPLGRPAGGSAWRPPGPGRHRLRPPRGPVAGREPPRAVGDGGSHPELFGSAPETGSLTGRIVEHLGGPQAQRSGDALDRHAHSAVADQAARRVGERDARSDRHRAGPRLHGGAGFATLGGPAADGTPFMKDWLRGKRSGLVVFLLIAALV